MVRQLWQSQPDNPQGFGMREEAEMSREVDAKVAELVMGWKRRTNKEAWGEGICDPENADQFDNSWYDSANIHQAYVEDEGLCREDFEKGWSPSTDPAADYEVLKRVRETWSDEDWTRFQQALYEGQRVRRPDKFYLTKCGPGCFYEPGDYSRAALSALAPKGVQ